MIAMPALARIVGAVALAALVPGCDHGGAFVVDNRTDQEFVARVRGYEDLRGSDPGNRDRQDVLVVPARSRVAVAVLTFTDAFHVQAIEILTDDCAPVAAFSASDRVNMLGPDGQVIVIDPGPSTKLAKSARPRGAGRTGRACRRRTLGDSVAVAAPDRLQELVAVLVDRVETKDRGVVRVVWAPPVRPFFAALGMKWRPRTDSNRRRQP